MGVRSLKVTARHSNNAGSSCEYPRCLEARKEGGREGGEGRRGEGGEARRGDGRGGEGGEGRGGEGRGGEGGILQGRYPEEGTGQYTVYSQTIHSAALALETLVQMKNSEHL